MAHKKVKKDCSRHFTPVTTEVGLPKFRGDRVVRQ